MKFELVELNEMARRLVSECESMSAVAYPRKNAYTQGARLAYERGLIRAASEISAFVAERMGGGNA